MFTIDSFVDTVQTSKKTWVKTFVTNDVMAKAMNEFIDTQSEYTKNAVKATTDVTTKLASESMKALQNTMKFDYVKFGEGIMKAYSNLQSGKSPM
jgi:hypothetical protein